MASNERVKALKISTAMVFVAVVVVGAVQGASAAAEATTTPETTVAPASPGHPDSALQTDVRRRFESFDDLDDVVVSVEAGVVTLQGEVSTLQAWRLAEDLARDVAGVSAVLNKIEIAADVRGQVNALRETLFRAANFAPVVGFAVAVLLFFVAMSWLVGRWSGPFERVSANRFVQEVVQAAVRGVLVLAGIVLALHIVDATAIAGALIGTAGVAGIALGFAFKDLIENFLASVLLSMRQPFAPNDFVNVDGFEGVVVRLTSRATVLMTPDGNHIRIPNAMVYKGVILNYTRNPRRRFEFVIAVASESDLSAAQQAGVTILREMSGVLDEPEPWSQIVEIGDSSIPIRFYGWVDQRATSFARAQSEAVRLVKEGLEAAGFELPEPIYRVRSEAVAPRAEERSTGTPAVELRTDISEHGDPIVGQIEHERRVTEVDDLLDPAAPRE
jgi:small-conductance mechanosensitive channel